MLNRQLTPTPLDIFYQYVHDFVEAFIFDEKREACRLEPLITTQYRLLSPQEKAAVKVTLELNIRHHQGAGYSPNFFRISNRGNVAGMIIGSTLSTLILAASLPSENNNNNIGAFAISLIAGAVAGLVIALNTYNNPPHFAQPYLLVAAMLDVTPDCANETWPIFKKS
jgi:hypothetical protein